MIFQWIDTHVTVVESQCPPLPSKVGKQLLTGHKVTPRRISLLIKEDNKNGILFPDLCHSVCHSLHLMQMRQLSPERISASMPPSWGQSQPWMQHCIHLLVLSALVQGMVCMGVGWQRNLSSELLKILL